MEDKRVAIERKEIENHENQEFAKMHLEAAAQAIKPWGFKHQGSVGIHMYEAASGATVFTFVTQTVGIGSVPEQECDAAMKEAKRTLMNIYGRTTKHLKGD